MSDGATHQPHIHATREQRLADGARKILMQDQLHARIAHEIFGDHAEHEDAAEAGREGKADLPGRLRGAGEQFLRNLVERAQQHLGALEQDRARFRRLHAARVAREKRNSERAFQRTDAPRNGGLRDVQQGGGARDVLLPHDLDENSQRVEVHRQVSSGSGGMPFHRPAAGASQSACHAAPTSRALPMNIVPRGTPSPRAAGRGGIDRFFAEEF